MVPSEEQLEDANCAERGPLLGDLAWQPRVDLSSAALAMAHGQPMGPGSIGPLPLGLGLFSASGSFGFSLSQAFRQGIMITVLKSDIRLATEAAVHPPQLLPLACVCLPFVASACMGHGPWTIVLHVVICRMPGVSQCGANC